MKVGELIDKLSQQDPNKEVIVTEQIADAKYRYKIDVVEHVLGKVVLIFYICEDDQNK